MTAAVCTVLAGASPAWATGSVASAGATVQQETAAPIEFTDDFERAAGEVGNGWTGARGTWRIADGEALNTVTGAQNNVLVQDGVELGAEWSVSSELRVAPYTPATGREWSGVAGNIQGVESGQLSYYLLRMTTAATSGSPTTGRWHVLKMTGNSGTQVLAEGTFDGPAARPGASAFTATLSRSGDELTAEISTAGGAVLLDRTVAIQRDVNLVGGHAGLYTVTDNLRAASASITTSTPAVSPPGALNCAELSGDYEFPQTGNEVLETSDLGLTWAGMFVVQDLLTRGDDQYVGFYDVERNMVIAHRTLPDGEWSYRTLDERIAWDSHNYISLGLDRDDTLHVSGNMHNVRLRYFKSAPGGDIETLERQSVMVDAATENSVTYPEFVNRKDGSLVFSHRNGGSGSGVTYFNVYNEQSGAWERLIDEPFFDGLGSADDPDGTWNSYFQGPTLGPDGMFHLLWVWRDTPDAATNSMLTYAKSDDLVNWVDATGKPLSTPFRYGEADVVDPIPDFAGLLNGNAKIGFTADDDVLISYHKYDQDGHSQLYAATPEGEDWKISQISDWDGRWSFGGGGTLIFEVLMLGSEVLSDGNVQVNFGCFGERQSIVIDPDLEPIAQTLTPALPGDLSEVRTEWDGEEALQVNVTADRGDVPEPATERGRYVLRWETLPENRDLPREVWPEQGSEIQVVLLGEREDETPEQLEPATTPRISGIARVGQDLTVALPTWSTDGVRHRVVWTRDGEAIPGATWSRYRLTEADAGSRIAAVVTGSKAGHADRSLRSNTSVPVRATVSTVGRSLSATTVRAGQRTVLTVAARAEGVRPSGVVDVYYNGRKVRDGLRLVNGRVSTAFQPGVRGTHTLRVVYRGNAAVRGSEASIRLRVL